MNPKSRPNWKHFCRARYKGRGSASVPTLPTAPRLFSRKCAYQPYCRRQVFRPAPDIISFKLRFREQFVLIRQALALLTLIGLLSACNLRRPEVTLTLALIDTRTPDATDVKELPTDTKAATMSPTPASTGTPRLSATIAPSMTATDTPTATYTDTPSATSTNTSTATDTDKPPATDSPAPTDTDLPIATATLRPTSTDTPLPTDRLDRFSWRVGRQRRIG